MKKNLHIILLIAAVIALALVLVLTFAHKAGNGGASAKTAEAQKKPLYWTCGMHPQVKQDKPGKCPVCAMALIPVYPQEQQAPQAKPEMSMSKAEMEHYGCGVKEEGHCPHCDKGIKDAKCICGGHSFVEKGQALKACPVCGKPLKKIAKEDLPKEMASAQGGKKVLYYRNPMHPEVTSPTPMKDEMGMDYVPVYEEAPAAFSGEEGVVNRVHLTQEQAGLAGVAVEILSRLKLSKEIRTVGRIAFDPELTVAQEEFLTAVETRQKVSQSPDPDVIARAQDLVEKSRFRLRLLGMSDQEIAQLEKDNVAQMNLVLPEDKAWVYADVYEHDLVWVKQGQEAEVAAAAYPGETFQGIIKAITPVLDPKTRTAKVRMEIGNPEKKLKPEMYVDVIIKAVYRGPAGSEEVLAVPRDAVLDTGLRKIVYIDAGSGTFLGKEITTGPESTAIVDGQKQSFYPVLSGLTGDERVVTKGNFLIDSQSQLTGGLSVLWGGAQEIKAEQAAPKEAAPVQTQHRH